MELTKENASFFIDKANKTNTKKLKQYNIKIPYNVWWARTYSEAVHCLMYDVIFQPICSCGKPINFYRLHQGYNTTCSSKCSNGSKEVIAKKQNTTIDNYGVRSPFLIPASKQKRKKVLLKKFGGHPSSNKAVQDKIAKTLKANHQEKIKTLEYQDYMTEKALYYNLVWHYTNLNDLTILPNIEKRGHHAYNPDAYHLDHRYSISEGFNSGIQPYIIGSIHNLEMIPALANIAKGPDCSIDETELYK